MIDLDLYVGMFSAFGLIAIAIAIAAHVIGRNAHIKREKAMMRRCCQQEIARESK